MLKTITDMARVNSAVECTLAYREERLLSGMVSAPPLGLPCLLEAQIHKSSRFRILLTRSWALRTEP